MFGRAACRKERGVVPASGGTPGATGLMWDTIAKSLSFLCREVGGEENGGRKKNPRVHKHPTVS